jgi:transposase-like protein
MLPFTALASLAAWSVLSSALPHCLYCHGGDVRRAPREGEPYRYVCNSCGQAFTHADDRPVGFLEALDAMSRRSELYAK